MLQSPEDPPMKFKLLPVLAVFIAGCGSSIHELTSIEQIKLDPPLQRLILGSGIDPADYDIIRGPDGEPRYGVLVRTSDPDEIKKAGYDITSEFNGVLVVRVTVPELRTLAADSSVQAISAGARFRTQQFQKPQNGLGKDR
jgi:hypothetical protein